MSSPTSLNKRTARSCGTCRKWIARWGHRYCPVLEFTFSNKLDLACVVCNAWQREENESFAVELWHELGGN